MHEMTNFYPEKPIVPYQRTKVEMAKVIAILQAAASSTEVKRTAYIIFRNESANGLSGVCNNYSGFQADSGRWAQAHDRSISGVVERVENGTGKKRLFLAFSDVSGCIGMLLERVQARGLYVGGTTHLIITMPVTSKEDLARAYKKDWVSGKKDAEPTEKEIENFVSMYNQAAKLFV